MRDRRDTDPVGVSWLITVRWTALLAGAGAILAGRSALQVPVPTAAAITALGVWGGSNVWLIWRVRRHDASIATIAGILICADVVVLSWLLLKSGGVLNPASVFYLVEIVVAALVLGRQWTWIVTLLSVAGYGALFLVPTDELRAAQVMHPEIALHMRGMWFAFAVTSLIVAVLVTRLVIAVERRDHALDQMRERSARANRAAGLATLAAGAAHELSTPLATIAIASRELERHLANTASTSDLPSQNSAAAAADIQQDVRLIRAETDRCRQILDAMAARSGEPVGELASRHSLTDLVLSIRGRLTPAEADRLDVELPQDITVTWPMKVVVQAVGNLVRNAIQASSETSRVSLRAQPTTNGTIQLTIADRGAGMSREQLSRAGEPFFTTKPPGEGTGLGVFVAQSSVEQLGGHLTLSSELGRGTIATVTLPLNVIAERSHADL